MRFNAWLLAVPAALLMLFACGGDAQRSAERPKEEMKSDKPQPTETGSAIAGKIGLKLPAAAKFEYAAYVEGHDDSARLIVRLPAAEWAELVKQAPFDQANFAPEGVYHLGPDGGEWTPRQEKGLLVAQLPYKNGRQSLNIGFSKAADGLTVRVYISWYQL